MVVCTLARIDVVGRLGVSSDPRESDDRPTTPAMARGTVDSDGLQLALFETSKVGLTIVFVHGFPDTHVLWKPVIAQLQSRFHCVAYDVRGAGESEIPPSRGGCRVGRQLSCRCLRWCHSRTPTSCL